MARIGADIAVESWLFMLRPCSLFGNQPNIAVVMTSCFQYRFVIFDATNWCHYVSSTKAYLNFPFNRLNHTSRYNFRESIQSTSRWIQTSQSTSHFENSIDSIKSTQNTRWNKSINSIDLIGIQPWSGVKLHAGMFKVKRAVTCVVSWCVNVRYSLWW